MTKLEIMEKISVIVSPIIGLFVLLWQTKKTFESERRATTKQFLNEAQLESVKEILGNVDKAYWLIVESGVTINREIDRLVAQNKGKINTRNI